MNSKITFKILLLAIVSLIAFGKRVLPSKKGKLSSGVEVEAWIMKLIHDNEVMVFAKSTCPHCKAAKYTIKTTLKELDLGPAIKNNIIDIDLLPKKDMDLIQDELMTITGKRTVPSVFVGHVFIGGNQELQQIVRDGRFEATLYKALKKIEGEDDL